MSFPAFPTTDDWQDSKKYSIEVEDPSIRSELEGGYVASRPRHTRRPRRTWSVGYTYISPADKKLITDFYDAVHGGSNIFTWLNTEDGQTYYVRFKGVINEKPSGRMNYPRWDLDFKLEEA